MKNLRPGQVCTINNAVYRARPRTHGCRGCDLDNLILCPNIVDRRMDKTKIECVLCGIILKRI